MLAERLDQVTQESTRHRRPFRSWHAAATFAFVVAGALFATTALSSNGLDLRAASITDLDGVVRAEKERSDDLQARLASLNQEVEALSHQVDDATVARLHDQVDALRDPAGFEAVSGPGVTVVLDDAPESEIDKARDDGGCSTGRLLSDGRALTTLVDISVSSTGYPSNFRR
jgi:uncharacterized protein YlxW (UPF0749 family)